MTDKAADVLNGYVLHITKETCNYKTIGLRVLFAVRFLEDAPDISLKGYKEWQRLHSAEFVNSPFSYELHIKPLLEYVGIRRVTKKKRSCPVLTRRPSKVEGAMNDYAIYLEQQNDLSPNTIKSYLFALSDFFCYADEMTNTQVKAYVNTLISRGLKANTINLRLCGLRLYAKMRKKPIDIKRFKTSRSLDLENVPTEEEFNTLLTWLRSNGKMRFYYMVKLLGVTGMRISELSKISWEQVVSGEALIISKGRKQRRVFFPRSICDEAKANGFSGLVMLSKSGDLLTTRGFSTMLKVYGTKCGIDKHKLHAHAFRHMFAKFYLKASGDLAQLSQLLGHQRLDTTQIYIQKSKDEQRKEFDQFVRW